jgi:ferredoxin
MAKITFKYPDGTVKTVEAPNGISVLEVAHQNEVPLEGACEGSLACSTCHCILEDEAVFDSLAEPSEEEEDMLDLAFGLTMTSRLGCQIMVNDELDGAVFKLPDATRNIAS